MEKQTITKEVYSCKGCGNTDILLLAWVDPNDGNKFVRKVDDTFDGLCNVCGDCVKLNIETIESEEDLWRCEECGSLHVKNKISVDVNSVESTAEGGSEEYLCIDCENESAVRTSVLINTIQEWWKYLEGVEKETITGIEYDTYHISDSDDDLQEADRGFSAACDEWWEKKSADEKIEMWKERDNR